MTTESEQALKKRKIEKETQPANMAHEILPVYAAGSFAAFGDYKVSRSVKMNQ